MVEAEVTRRLTTIVAADIAGYSRLMGADEEATLAALAQSGRIDDAQWEVAEILTLDPGVTIASERKITPYAKPSLERYLDGLRKAGLPE
jgi:hypothetical protein